MSIVWIIVISVLGVIIGIPLLMMLFLEILNLCVKQKDYDKHSRFYRSILNFYVGFFLMLMNVKFVIKGKEKLDGIGRFLLVINHRSVFDPVIAFMTLKEHDVAFLSKPSNFKVIFFGRIIRKCCFRAIDRDNARNALVTIKESAKLIKNDQVSIGVCPEGTRSKTGELLPFHDGVFMIASLANVPVVVGVVTGTEEFKKHPVFKRTVITFEILSVISAEVVKSQSTHQTADMAREEMLNALGK